MLANVCKIDIPVTPNYHLACKNCFHIVHSFSVSCPIPSTASCTLTSISETTYSFTMLYHCQTGVSVCANGSAALSKCGAYHLVPASCYLLPGASQLLPQMQPAGPSLELYIPPFAIAMWVQTPIDSIQTVTCSWLVDIGLHFIPGGHVRL